jgi:C4-dicarboxylate-specific signal transduction histidine kinase
MNPTGSHPAQAQTSGTPAKERGPLAHLLHALNQPLTGLQCSLELALAAPRTSAQNTRTLREGLELTGRMRILVEAIRELADVGQEEGEEREVVPLGPLLRETVDDLRPVAEAGNIQIRLEGDALLPVRASRSQLAAVAFRFFEAALSLAERRSVFRIVTKTEREDACLDVGWKETTQAPEHSPFSRQELGLMIAKAGWRQAGAEWTSDRAEHTQTVTIRLPLASKPNLPLAD